MRPNGGAAGGVVGGGAGVVGDADGAGGAGCAEAVGKSPPLNAIAAVASTVEEMVTAIRWRCITIDYHGATMADGRAGRGRGAELNRGLGC